MAIEKKKKKNVIRRQRGISVAWQAWRSEKRIARRNMLFRLLQAVGMA